MTMMSSNNSNVNKKSNKGDAIGEMWAECGRNVRSAIGDGYRQRAASKGLKRLLGVKGCGLLCAEINFW